MACVDSFFRYGNAVLTILLKVIDLTRNFGGLRAVDGLSFEVSRREIVGMIGPNGAGKTTAFNLVSGVIPPTSGQVIFNGRNLVGYRPSAIVRFGLARTFQAAATFSHSSVLENVIRGALCRNRVSFFAGVFNTSAARMATKHAERRANELIDLLLLGDYRHSLAGALSYGNQRRLGVAIALATEPQLLLLDEPVAGLSPEEAREFETLIRRVVSHHNVSVLLIEHHIQLVMRMCERVVVLNHGVKIAEGSAHEIQHNEDVIEAYLGSPELPDHVADSRH